MQSIKIDRKVTDLSKQIIKQQFVLFHTSQQKKTLIRSFALRFKIKN